MGQRARNAATLNLEWAPETKQTTKLEQNGLLKATRHMRMAEVPEDDACYRQAFTAMPPFPHPPSYAPVASHHYGHVLGVQWSFAAEHVLYNGIAHQPGTSCFPQHTRLKANG